MESIKQYDEYIEAIEAGEEEYDAREVDNFLLFNAYYKSVWRDENEVIDFSEFIWADYVPEIVDAMIEHGVKDFTISSDMAGIQHVIAEFMDNGAIITGMKNVYTSITDIRGNKDTVPAFMMHILDYNRF